MSIYKKLLLVSIIFYSYPLFSQIDYYSPQAIMAFAQWLETEGEYRRAASEYLRYLFMTGESEDNDALLFKIGMCYEKATDYSLAIKNFFKIIEKFPESSFFEKAYYEISYCYFKLQSYQQSLDTITSIMHYTSPLNEHFLLLQGVNLLCLKQWQSAYNIFDDYLNLPPSTSRYVAQELKALALKAQILPQKNPFLAGLFSTIIPGTGKMYAERAGDGFFSLITICIFGGMAAYSFYEDGIESFNGWIYASIGAIFYIGNIYGSVMAAQIYNENQEKELMQNVMDTIDVRFP